MNGLLNLYKPRGPTSFSLCYDIRKLLHKSPLNQVQGSNLKSQIKVGHTGTLDPIAEGVLLVCLGKATKIIPLLQKDKEYVARIRLGVKTETDDTEGKVIEEDSVPPMDRETICKALKGFEGEIEQTPPLYSAIWVKGERLYHLARKTRGFNNPSTHQPPFPKPRKVNIFKIQLLQWENPEIEILVHCSRGTYIRSLARDIGDRIGCGGHIASLKRTRVGKFKIEDSLTIHESPFTIHQLQDHLISMNSALDHLPRMVISDSLREPVLHGNPFPIQQSTFSIPHSAIHTPHRRWRSLRHSALRILSETGDLLAIGKQKGDEIHPLCVLV